MIIVKPQTVDATVLTASDVPADDYATWVAGTYNAGDRVIYGQYAYEALGTTTDQPDVGADQSVPTWYRLGYINRWRMFTEGSDSKTAQAGGIAVELTPGVLVNACAVLGVQGLAITVQMTDPVDGLVYDVTEQVSDIGVENWYDWYFHEYATKEDFAFTDLPPYASATISIEVTTATPADEAKVGRVVIGQQTRFGYSLYGTAVGAIDYSVKERDGFGTLRLVKRRSVKIIEFDVQLPTAQIDMFQRRLMAISAEPTVYVGHKDFGGTIAFGVFRDFRIVHGNPKYSNATVTVEGY